MSDDEGIKQLGPKRWAVRVKRKDSARGKVVNRKATVIGTKADALRERDRIREQLELAATFKPRTQLKVFAGSWVLRRAETLKPSVWRKYGFILRHITRELGELYVDAIRATDVEAYVARRLLAGAAGNTVLNELRTLRAMARDSVSERFASSHWCERVRAPKVARYTAERPNLLSPQQAALVLALVPRQWLGLVLFLMTSGLRFGEVSALRWEDVDVDAGVARIEYSNYRGQRVDVKTDSSHRTVAVLPEVLALWPPRRKPGSPIFATRTGLMHRGSPLRSVLDKACKAAGVPRVTTHGLRRTFNNMGRKLGDREVLQATTGHTTDEMTSHYSLVDDAEKAVLARAVAAAIGVLSVSGSRTEGDDK